MMKVAEFIVKQLARWGVKRIYGVTGDAIFPLMEALGKQKDIEFILTSHESAAGFMASAEAKLTGRPGVCIATSGPGLANLLNGLGDAAIDRVPVIAISGQVPREKIGTSVKQYIDQMTFVRPVASYTAEIVHPSAAFSVLSRAWETAQTQQTVAHISLPKDVGDLPVSVNVRPSLDDVHGGKIREGNTTVSYGELQLAARMIQNSRRPMILAGIGAKAAWREVVQLAERLNAGIILSLGAKGAIPDAHPRLLGGIGSGGRRQAVDLLYQSDLFIMIGVTWYPQDYIPEDIPVIQIDIHPAHISSNKDLTAVVTGRANDAITSLLKILPEQERSQWGNIIKQAKKEQQEENLQEEMPSPSDPVSPAYLMQQLSRHVQDDAIVTVDTGEHTIWTNRRFAATHQHFLFSGTWRSMGFALPAAIAAKKIYPEKQVVAITGDGGLLMSMGELVTAVRERLDLKILVVHNRVLGMEKNKMLTEGRTPFGVELHTPDFAMIAQACGGRGITVSGNGSLNKALSQAFQTDLQQGVPVLIDVHCNNPVPEDVHPTPQMIKKREQTLSNLREH